MAYGLPINVIDITDGDDYPRSDYLWAIPPSRTLHSDSILNSNLAQTKYKIELSSFSFMNMYVPTDMLFFQLTDYIRDIEGKNTVAEVTCT